MLGALLLAAGAAAEEINPPDTSLDTLPVVYYGANWNRTQQNIDVLARFQMVILMQVLCSLLELLSQALSSSSVASALLRLWLTARGSVQEDGHCWATCCPDRFEGGPQCGELHNATAIPGCDSSCEQHASQAAVFTRMKASAAAQQRRPGHAILYMNSVYLWRKCSRSLCVFRRG